MSQWMVSGLAAIALLVGAYWAGHHRGWDARDVRATAEMAELSAKLNQRYVDAQVRVHQADLDTAAATLHFEPALRAVRVDLPMIVREAQHAIDNTPTLADCRLPDDLRRLRKQQAVRSAEIATQATGAER